jgi:O-methyltransferase involved in polyketide biosynthesis
MYLTEPDVKELFNHIKRGLGDAEIVCEVTNRYWVDKMNNQWVKWKFKRKLGIKGGAVFTFGVPDSNYFESWDKNYRLLDEWTYFDDKEKKLGWFNLFSSFRILRKVQWTVHYKITKEGTN